MHRAFASVPETCKDQMEAVLKQKLTAAFARSESWSVDWEKEPLPVLVFVFVYTIMNVEFLIKIKLFYRQPIIFRGNVDINPGKNNFSNAKLCFALSF